MALSTGKLGVLIHGNRGEAHYDALMHRWRCLDAIINPTVDGIYNSPPPTWIQDGVCFIVGYEAQGEWEDHAGAIARWHATMNGPDDGGWEYFSPRPGWEAHNEGEGKRYRYDGSRWQPLGGVIFSPVEGMWPFMTDPIGPEMKGKYLRYGESGVKQLVLAVQGQNDLYWSSGDEVYVRNASISGNLTIVKDGSEGTIHAPYGGSLVVPPRGTVTLKFGGDSHSWDVWGDTLPPA